MPGRDPARGARDTGRTGGGIGAKDGARGHDTAGRSMGARKVYDGPIGPTRSGAPMGTGGHINEREPDSTVTSNPLDRLLGYDTLGERRKAYANNPNRPGYDTKTMGYPVNMSLMDVLSGANLVGDPVFNAGLNTVGTLASGIGPGLGATRAIQAATGYSGGPAPGGFGDKLSATPRDSRVNDDGTSSLASDPNALGTPSLATTMETLLEYSSKGGAPVKKSVPIPQQTAIPSPFTAQPSGVVG